MLSIFMAWMAAVSPSPEMRVPADAERVSGVAVSAERRLSYTWQQVWTSALRLIRVDRGWTIEDRDSEAGFVMFHEGGEASPTQLRGSFELLARGQGDSPELGPIVVRAKLQNAGTHAAFTLLGALEKKLRQDFGPPTPRKKPRPKTPAPSKPKPSPPRDSR